MSEILGEARILIRPDTTAFRAQLEAQVLAASRSIPPVTVPVFAGGTGGTGVISKEIEQRQVLSGVIHENARSTSAEAKAVQDAARHHEQFGRGIGANILQLLGLRGATLAASTAFIGGAAATIIAAKSIGAASDRTEQLNKSVEVFVASADSVKQWATTTATSMGISETAALSAASTFGQLFRTLGVGPAQAAHLSESLVRLASDLASFNNVGTDRALAALQSGLVGQARPLRQLGIFLTAARVQQEAFAETGKKTASELTQQDTILARYNLILQDSALAAGDFQRTQGRLANQGRILQAQLADLAATTGSVLIPALTEAIGTVNNLLLAFTRAETGAVHLFAKIKSGAKDVADAIPKTGGDSFASRVLGDLKGPIADLGRFGASVITATSPAVAFGLRVKTLVDILAHFGESANNAGNQLSNFARDSGDAAAAQERLAGSVDHATRSLSAQSQVLSDQLQKAQAAGAGPTAQLAIVQQRLSVDIAAQRRAEANQGRTGGITAVRAARAQVIKDRDEIKSLQGEISSAVGQSASAAKKVATDIQNARDKADQEILGAITGKQTRIENLIARAQNTSGLRDDLKFERALLKFFVDTLAAVRRSALSAKAKADEIGTLTREIIDQRNIVKKAVADAASAAKDAAQQAIDTQEQILQLNIQIAQTTGNVSAQERADKAYITFLDKQIKAAKGNRLKVKQLRLERAQTEADLKSLTQQTNKNTDAAKGLKQAEFNFLQTQTGFVSNLLGNLIPGGATAGLVGGGGGPSVPSNVRPTGQLSAAQTTSQANLVRPFTSGQGETQTNILRHILAELHRLNTGNDHPEAHKQRRTGAAVMDFQSASPGF